MPGPGAYWFGEEEMKAVTEVMQSGYLFRYGSDKDLRFLHKVATLEKNLPDTAIPITQLLLHRGHRHYWHQYWH